MRKFSKSFPSRHSSPISQQPLLVCVQLTSYGKAKENTPHGETGLVMSQREIPASRCPHGVIFTVLQIVIINKFGIVIINTLGTYLNDIFPSFTMGILLERCILCKIHYLEHGAAERLHRISLRITQDNYKMPSTVSAQSEHRSSILHPFPLPPRSHLIPEKVQESAEKHGLAREP